jgi:hypothetical protein
MGDDTGVLHEHKQELFTPQDKREDYGDSKSKRLTKKAEHLVWCHFNGFNYLRFFQLLLTHRCAFDGIISLFSSSGLIACVHRPLYIEVSSINGGKSDQKID